MIDSKLIQRRVQAVRRLMKKKNINCLLLTKPANVTYLTGFLGYDAWAVVTPTNTYLLTDSRYIEQAEKECVRCKPILRKETLHNTLAALVKELKTIRTVAVEETIGLKDFRQLEKIVKARLRIASKIVEAGRSIKDAFEIVSIKKAIQISAKAMNETLKFLRPGVTENEVAGFLDYQIRRFGGKIAFETIVAFGPNASRPHHQPGETKLKKNDVVLVDFGGEFNHYCCDITRTFLVGRPNPFFERVYKAVKRGTGCGDCTGSAGDAKQTARKESQRDDKKKWPAALPARHRPRLRAGGARRAVSGSQKQGKTGRGYGADGRAGNIHTGGNRRAD